MHEIKQANPSKTIPTSVRITLFSSLSTTLQSTTPSINNKQWPLLRTPYHVSSPLLSSPLRPLHNSPPLLSKLTSFPPSPMYKNPIIFLLLFSFFFLSTSSQNDSFTYLGFNSGANSNTASISLNGISEIESSGLLRLTNETSRLIGHAFYPSAIQFRNSTDSSAFSFSTAFAFAIVPEYATLGGHGLAFVVSTSKELAGALPSQYLGILNATDVGNATEHLFAVEFDTVQDFEFADINDNHVGLDINNLVSNKSAPAGLNLKSGATVQAWVDYDGVGKLVSVSVSGSSSKPKKPLFSFPVDLSPVLKDQMFVGFSASTGLLASSHYIMGWSFSMNGVAQSLDLSSLPSLPPQPKKKNSTFIIATAFSAFVFLVAILALSGYLFYKIKNADVIEPWELEYGPHRYSYKELKRATKGFRGSELLGSGGFGKVFKGTLQSSRSEIAVKRVSHESRQGIREFVAEIASIGRLRHRNLVQLLGWCRRRGDLLLVYDYMPNGSLDKLLFCDDSSLSDSQRRHLSWSQRFQILRGVAAALLYLHEEWEHVVIHRDVKASNVLLDAEFNGRLGDFGLAKLYEHGANPSTTRVVGTVGYLAPELTRTGRATTGTDVFAFGALVLEVVCGRRPIELKAAAMECVLVDWVGERWAKGKWEEVVDPRLRGEYKKEEVEVVIKVGLMCSNSAAVARPSMREVVRFLDSADVVEVPSPKSMEYYEGVGQVGLFDNLNSSYPSSSSFEKVSAGASSYTVSPSIGTHY